MEGLERFVPCAFGWVAVLASACNNAPLESAPIVRLPDPVLQAISIRPPVATILPGGYQIFEAFATWDTGGGQIAAAFSATGGWITPGGFFTADTVPGSYRVIAAAPGGALGALADTAEVILVGAVGPPPPPPPVGPYATVAKQDWSTYADRTALAGMFGVEGRLNECKVLDRQTGGTRCDPHLPVSAFWDLVPDPLFGKVIRYNGGPRLNTYAKNMPGRVAIHGIKFVATPLAHLWVRQFLRFSANYTTTGRAGGQGAASHKAMFLRYPNNARHEWTIDGPRGMMHSGGNSGGGKVVNEGNLPINNVQSINAQYHVQGWFFPDAYPMIKVPCFPTQAPCGEGNGEWYEVIMHHKTVAERGEFTMYWRRYTVGGAVSPEPWKISSRYRLLPSGVAWKPIIKYEMGVNRNRQWDEDMYIYWGPYEVVDGSQFPNPWGLPGG